MSRRKLLRTAAVSLLLGLVAACSVGGPEGTLSVDPPRSGAFFGAYVDPPEYTEPGRIAAFNSFESQLGRRLDIFHNYHTWGDPFPDAADRYFARRGTRVLLSWGGTDTDAISAGTYDALIRQRAEDLKQLSRPVLLEWRWEMNRPNLRSEIHSGAEYVAAWRHIHAIFDQVGAHNVRWVWCPLSDVAADLDFSMYYPGDRYVDWIGADGYPRSPDQSFAQVFAPFMVWAAAVHKPIIIGEFGQQAGARGSRADWLDDARVYVKDHPQIKAISYFESARGVSGSYAVATEYSALVAMTNWAHDAYFLPGRGHDFG